MLKSNGFTLIELLIVLTILAILGTYIFVNFRDFTKGQLLNTAVIQTQSILREAQSNAFSGTLCGVSGGASWSVKFRLDKVNLDLTCGSGDSLVKTQTLEGVEVSSITCSPPANSSCPPQGSIPFSALTVKFSYLSGAVTFSEGDSCVNSAQSLMIALKTSENNNYKCFTISKGGAIDVK